MIIHRTAHGACTNCGKQALLTILDDVDWVCEECLDSLFIQCDICGEYYDGIEFYDIDDKCVCEYCAEDLQEAD